MRRIKLEKISGIVALSYLVLIPVGAYLAWKKIQEIDRDVVEIMGELKMEPTEQQPLIDFNNLKQRLFG